MGLKAVESFDGSFTLDTVAQEVLFQLLHSEPFRQQVVAPSHALAVTSLRTHGQPGRLQC